MPGKNYILPGHLQRAVYAPIHDHAKLENGDGDNYGLKVALICIFNFYIYLKH